MAEEAIRGAPHVRHVLGMRADAPENAEYRLDEERRLHEPAVGEVAQRVEMADVVALDLEARVVRAARFEDVLDVLERVLEDALVGAGEVRPLPVVLELAVAPEH